MTKIQDVPGTTNEEVQALLDLQLNYGSNQVRTAEMGTQGTGIHDESSYLDISKDVSRGEIRIEQGKPQVE